MASAAWSGRGDAVEREDGEAGQRRATGARGRRCRGGAGAAEGREDREEDVVGEGAEAVFLLLLRLTAGGVGERGGGAARQQAPRQHSISIWCSRQRWHVTPAAAAAISRDVDLDRRAAADDGDLREK